MDSREQEDNAKKGGTLKLYIDFPDPYYTDEAKDFIQKVSVVHMRDKENADSLNSYYALDLRIGWVTKVPMKSKHTHILLIWTSTKWRDVKFNHRLFLGYVSNTMICSSLSFTHGFISI